MPTETTRSGRPPVVLTLEVPGPPTESVLSKNFRDPENLDFPESPHQLGGRVGSEISDCYFESSESWWVPVGRSFMFWLRTEG